MSNHQFCVGNPALEYNTLSMLSKGIIIGMALVSISLLAFVHFTSPSKEDEKMDCFLVGEQAELLMKFRQTGMDRVTLEALVYSGDKSIQKVNNKIIPFVYEVDLLYTEGAKNLSYILTYEKGLNICLDGEL